VVAVSEPPELVGRNRARMGVGTNGPGYESAVSAQRLGTYVGQECRGRRPPRPPPSSYRPFRPRVTNSSSPQAQRAAERAMAAICGLQLPSIRFFGMPQVLLRGGGFVCAGARVHRTAQSWTGIGWTALNCLNATVPVCCCCARVGPRTPAPTLPTPRPTTPDPGARCSPLWHITRTCRSPSTPRLPSCRQRATSAPTTTPASSTC
jgi:hypothetical protein